MILCNNFAREIRRAKLTHKLCSPMENSEYVKVVVLDKTFAKIVNTRLKLENKVDDTFRVTNRANANKILIPVKNIGVDFVF